MNTEIKQAIEEELINILKRTIMIKSYREGPQVCDWTRV